MKSSNCNSICDCNSMLPCLFCSLSVQLLAQRDRTKITVHRIENGVRIVDVADEPTKPKPEPLSRKFFSNLFGVQKGASLNGQIVHVIDPDAFYIRLDESDSNKFAAFDVDMQTEYNQTDARCSYQVDVPRPGCYSFLFLSSSAVSYSNQS